MRFEFSIYCSYISPDRFSLRSVVPVVSYEVNDSVDFQANRRTKFDCLDHWSMVSAHYHRSDTMDHCSHDKNRVMESTE